MEQYIVYTVITFILLSLYFNWLGASFTFVLGVLTLGFAGILSPKEILSGFANEQIIIIIVLLLIGDIIRSKGILNNFFEKFVFRGARTYHRFLGRMMFMVAGSSAFLNNTPLVAVMMPYVNKWSGKNDMASSKFLIPLSFAAILGGTITLIGTSTNLIVNGMLQDQKIIPNFHSLDIFDFAWVGIPMSILGLTYLMIFSKKLLPSNKDISKNLESNLREYLVEVKITSKSDLIGKTVSKAGLRNLKSLYLVEVEREGYVYSATSPNFLLRQDDILSFAGDTAALAEIIDPSNGMQIEHAAEHQAEKKTGLLEVVVAANSVLVNKTVKQSNFRSKYDASVIAVHRNGEKLKGKIGNIIIKAGDVLLMLTGEDFESRSFRDREFYRISKLRTYEKPKVLDTIVLIGGLIAAIMLSAFKIIPLFIGVLGLLAIVLILGIANPKEIEKGIDFNLGLTISMALALGTAMTNTGVAADISHGIINLLAPLGILGLLAGVYIATSILAAYITNVASVAILFPIVLSIAAEESLNPLPFVLLIAYAAAANFMTPIGYQTNMMVYGPGSYKFTDYLKIGLPLTVLYGVGAVLILWWRFFV
ncbi:SLC13 family permease [Lentimicrobium sp. S6]|uniref:SLC13 family permease n=1 Tax=Lentimicrobium sp. S6 TaxID=2735872 RepID=UPI00155516A2|nr:SLC13 family permease [Lentimicrobium sp. S6]NPD46758.1 SLC13 family permease [Lentimicrobium sp. S6]